MSWMVRSTWLAVPVIAASIGIAATRGDHGDRSEAAKPVAVAAARPKGEKKRVELDQELVTALYRVGLQPENLAAAGVAADVVDDVVVGVKTWLGNNAAALSRTDDRYFNAISNRDRLVRKVVSGLASGDEIEECQAAKAEFEAASAEKAATLTDAFNAGTAAVSAELKQLLTKIQVNQLEWDLALQYLVVERTQEDWVLVRDALSNERVALKRGEEPDPAEQALLATVRADVAVAAAKTSLDTTLGAVRAAWDAAAAVE